MLELAPVRRLLMVDPCEVCLGLLPELLAQGWSVKTCTLGAASEFPCDIAILRLRPFHLEWPEVIKGLITSSAAEWVAIIDEELLRLSSAGDFVCEWFFEFLTLPVEIQTLQRSLDRALGMLHSGDQETLGGVLEDDELLGESRAIRELRRLIGKLAATESPVLIRGEVGTGKERVARSLHRQSRRQGGAFVVFNCAPLPIDTLHRELFGFEPGAFLGARQGDTGRLEEAQGGTLFLHGVDALPLETQVQLLACLQDKAFQRQGSQIFQALDVRVLAASTVNLEAAVAAGRFSNDLFYRLNVLQVETLPLRERQADLALLARHFADLHGLETGRPARGFSEGALVSMARYQWPGNVRELSNRVRRGMLLAQGPQIEAPDLGLPESGEAFAPLRTLEEYKQGAERQALYDVLAVHSGNLSAAAKALGISRPTFYRLLHKHQIR